MCSHIAVTLEHLEARVVGCSLVGRRYFRSKYVAMVDSCTTCIEVLCEVPFCFSFCGYDVLKDCYRRKERKRTTTWWTDIHIAPFHSTP